MFTSLFTTGFTLRSLLELYLPLVLIMVLLCCCAGRCSAAPVVPPLALDTHLEVAPADDDAPLDVDAAWQRFLELKDRRERDHCLGGKCAPHLGQPAKQVEPYGPFGLRQHTPFRPWDGHYLRRPFFGRRK